jgi:hypothetical protein
MMMNARHTYPGGHSVRNNYTSHIPAVASTNVRRESRNRVVVR